MNQANEKASEGSDKDHESYLKQISDDSEDSQDFDVEFEETDINDL